MAHLGIDFQVYSLSARIPNQADAIRFIFKSDEFVTIPPNGTASVSTGVGFQMPNGVGGLAYPVGEFYSIYFPKFLTNTDNRPLAMKIWNPDDEPMHIMKGTTICKMLCQRLCDFNNLEFTKHMEEAIEPVKNLGDPGWMLKSPQDYTIEPNCSELIPTGISTLGIEGYNGYVYPLHDFATTNHLISNTERKEINISIANCSDESIHITRGEDLAVLCFNRALHVNFNIMQVHGLNHPPHNPNTFLTRRG